MALSTGCSTRKCMKIHVNLGVSVKSDNEDRISQLPDHLLHHIMTLLTPQELDRTSILSKRWHNVRTSIPYFAFHLKNFERNLSRIKKCTEDMQGIELKKFESYVNRSVSKFCEHNIPMQQFCLFMSYGFWAHPDIEYWLRLALEKNVKELDLHFVTNLHDMGYQLPVSIFAAKSLIVLRLNGCCLKDCLLHAIKIQSLHELLLVNVTVRSNIVQNLILGCPLIEKLIIKDCQSVKNLRLSSLVRLKKLELRERCSNSEYGFETIEFGRLNLQSLLCYFGKKMLFDMDSYFLKNLEFLSIYCNTMTDRLLEDIISTCQVLKTLVIIASTQLERFKISSNRLKKFSISNVYMPVDAVIDTPNLCSFKYDGNYLVPFLFSMDMPIRLQKSTLRTYRFYLNAFRFLKLRAYLGKFNKETVFTLCMISCKVTFIPEELRDAPIPSVPEIKHLKLKMDSSSCEEKKSLEALVDGLLWSSHPVTLSMELGRGSNNEFVKVLCRKLIDRKKIQECCSAARIDCWHHCLKHYEIECVGDNVKTFFCGNSLLQSSSNLVNGQRILFRFEWYN